MMTPVMSRRAQELADRGVSFVTATVVHALRPTSVQAGNVALVLPDGTIEGFVGGVCSEHSVRAYSLQTLQTGEAVLLRILPFPEDGAPAPDAVAEDGAVVVQNPCLSGGAIEVFLEPVLPAPRVLVVGDTPIAAAVVHLGGELGFDLVRVNGDGLELRPDDLALVVAAHGRDELHTLRLGLESELPYVGLVASPKRGTGVLAELRGDGVPDDLLARIDVPAGLDIGARTPSEIALSILARIIAVRRDARSSVVHEQHPPVAISGRAPAASSASAPAPGPLAIDPICGMTVAALASTPSVEHAGETVYFCCEGCKTRFVAGHDHASVGD
jgi:xanthine dehydrogenase accessory factor